MVKRGVNYTSTKTPMWQADLENFRRALLPFQLREVGPEHSVFIETFTKTYNIECVREGSTVTFYPVR